MTQTQKFLPAAILGIAAFAMATFAFALHSPEHYSLFGDAAYDSPGNASARAVELTSDAAPGFGGIDYGVEAGVTFADIAALSTDYKFDSGSCGGGSPRFQINVEDPNSADTGNIHAYIGPPPNYTLCPVGVYANSGDLLEGVNPIDTSQLDGGTFYDPYATALVKYGDYIVTGVQLVADAGWAVGGEQIVDIDNTIVDSTLFTYEIPVATDANACKNGGWKNLADDQGNSFKNQGDCVSFVATKGKNKGAGN